MAMIRWRDSSSSLNRKWKHSIRPLSCTLLAAVLKAIVRLLPDYGAHVDAKNHLNQIPLYLDSFGVFARIVKVLFEEGIRNGRITLKGHSAL